MNAWVWYILVGFMMMVFLPMAIAGFSFAPWVPSKKKDLARIATIINLQPHETLYEIGCGNGRVSLYVHDHSLGNVVGIERAWPLVVWCLLRKWLGRKKRFVVKHENAFFSDYSEAQTIFIFGMPKPVNDVLSKILKKSCASGTRVISYVFAIDAWTPISVDKPSLDDLAIYTYLL